MFIIIVNFFFIKLIVNIVTSHIHDHHMYILGSGAKVTIDVVECSTSQ